MLSKVASVKFGDRPIEIDGHRHVNIEDLKEYEEVKKSLDVLEILKKCDDNTHTLYYVYVLNAHGKGLIGEDECALVKEWLENDK